MAGLETTSDLRVDADRERETPHKESCVDNSRSSSSLDEISHRATTRLLAGESSFPTSLPPISTDIRASAMTSILASGRHLIPETESPATSINPTIRYNQLAGNFTSHTINEEQAIAKREWNSRSDAQRQQMMKEQRALLDYKSDMSPNALRPDTPALDAFNKALSPQLASLEQRRSLEITQAWQNLTPEARFENLVRDEMERELNEHKYR